MKKYVLNCYLHHLKSGHTIRTYIPADVLTTEDYINAVFREIKHDNSFFKGKDEMDRAAFAQYKNVEYVSMDDPITLTSREAFESTVRWYSGKATAEEIFRRLGLNDEDEVRI